MRRSAVLLAVAVVAVACGRKERAPGGEGGTAQAEGLLSATGVVADVKERSVRVRTEDGRVLDLALGDDVTVTLGGGEAQEAVITEGAPVRVSYEPKGSGGDLVSIDVEPQGPGTQARGAEPPADRAREPARGSPPAGGGR